MLQKATKTVTSVDQTLCEAEWKRLQSEHRVRISELIDDYLRRRQNHEKDPVMDFLFEYYAFPPSRLKHWTPGFGVFLESASEDELSHDSFTYTGDGAYLDPAAFPGHRLGSLQWILSLLENSRDSEPFFGCFGMHEWAMVYKADSIRHEQIPLRMPEEELEAFVESRPLVCTHYDAFRFFTEEARPKNKYRLTRNRFPDTEQPACVHTNMDLYKWAFKGYPWISSKLIRPAFELALKARIVDMKASPYDLRERGLQPIKIETDEGRREYIRRQRELYEESRPIRNRLIEAYTELVASLTDR